MAASKTKYPLGSPQEHIEMCKSHDLPIDMFCEDCDEFICAKCAKTDHKEHEWSTIPTAATQRRRDLLKFMKKIKDEDLLGIDEKMEKVSNQITENKEDCDSEITKVQKQVDEIITRWTDIRKNTERRLRDNLQVKNKRLNEVKSGLHIKKKEIEEMVKFMEDNNSTMSDYGLIDNHRELTKKLSGQDVTFNNSNYSMRYVRGEISDEVMENIIGKTLDLDDINLTEANSFRYGDKEINVLKALCEDQCYVRDIKSNCIEQVNKDGEKKHKYNINANDVCVTDTGDVYFTDFSNKSISCLSPLGSVTVISTDPVRPLGIRQSVDDGLLVILIDGESEFYKLESHSRRLVRQITVTGDVIHEYEYQEDGHTRMFIFPYRLTQNSNSDICVVNRTSRNSGNLMIISPSCRIKSVYHGQNLKKDFHPTDVVCDSLCNILVTDPFNKQIHLLSPDGEFYKFLLTDEHVNHPRSLSLYKSTLWVGYWEGLIKVFQYKM